MLKFRSPTAFAVITGALIIANPAEAWSSAEPSAVELNEARERFAEGRKLEEAGQFAQALVLFQNVARVKMTPQVRFHIALCLMHTGKPIEALANFRTAMKEAEGSAPNVVTESKEHITKLEQQVANVTIDVPAGTPSSSVMFDENVVVPGASFDAEPGTHRVVLERDGQTIDERRVTLRAGERSRIELLAPDASSTSTNSIDPRKVGAIVSFSVAGASLVALGVFAALRADRLAELEATCPSLTGCSRSLEPVVRDGKTYAIGVNIFGGLAAATAITGVVLYVSSIVSKGANRRAEVPVRVLPMVGIKTGFVALEAKF